MFEKIKNFYDKGLWNGKQVLNAVDKKIITDQQANTILTGG